MKRLRKMAQMVGLTLVVLLVAACGSQPASESTPQKAPETTAQATTPAATPTPAQQQKWTLATATSGGVFWPMGQEMAANWKGKVPNLEITAITTGGTAENIQKLGFKEVELGFAVSGVVFSAVNGTGDYKSTGKQSSLRGVLALHPNVVHMVVRKDAGITSISALKGKAWAPGARGSATEINTREIMGVFGMDSGSDLKGFYVGYNETVENMKSGKVDGATLAAGIGGKAIKDALALGGWEILSLTQAEVDAITKEYPAYFPVTIPAGSYEGQSKDILTVAQASILVTREDIPEAEIYALTKAFYESLSALGSKVAAANDIKQENGLKGITGVVPVHPGAAKYFKEVGVLK